MGLEAAIRTVAGAEKIERGRTILRLNDGPSDGPSDEKLAQTGDRRFGRFMNLA
jgi:hypothetical protein